MFKLDKILHFLVSYFIAASIFIVVGDIFLAAITALVIGVIKELRDKKWDWFDMLANAFGILILVIQIAL